MELRPVGLLRVEYERILALLLELGVVVPQMPVTACDSLLADSLRTRHTTLDTVVDTRSVGNDKRRSGICLGFLQHVEQLVLRSADRNLSHIHITIGHGHGTEILLADTLAARSELGNGTDRSSLRRLASGVRIYLGINYQNIHIGTRRQNVVYTAVADIVTPAITTDDPLRLLHQPILHLEDLLAGIAAASLHHRDKTCRNLGRLR